MLIFILGSCGIVVKFLRIYHINYMYIFELDPAYKITHAQLFKVRLINTYTLYIDGNHTFHSLVLLFNESDILGEDGTRFSEVCGSLHTGSSSIFRANMHTTI